MMKQEFIDAIVTQTLARAATIPNAPCDVVLLFKMAELAWEERCKRYGDTTIPVEFDYRTGPTLEHYRRSLVTPLSPDPVNVAIDAAKAAYRDNDTPRVNSWRRVFDNLERIKGIAEGRHKAGVASHVSMLADIEKLATGALKTDG